MDLYTLISLQVRHVGWGSQSGVGAFLVLDTHKAMGIGMSIKLSKLRVNILKRES